MMKVKNILILLAIVLIATCIFGFSTVQAANEYDISGTTYSSLSDAINAAPDGVLTTINLIADVANDTSAPQMIDKIITLNLNGHTLNLSAIGDNGIEIIAGSTLTVVGPGTLNVDCPENDTAIMLFIGFGSNGGTLHVTGNATVNATAPVYTALWVGAESTVSMDSGSTINATGVTGVYATDNGQATVSTVTASGAGSVGVIANRESTITVKGNVTVTGAGSIGVLIDWEANGAEVTIDGTITTPTTYISFDGTNITAGDNTIPTTKAGYLTYTDSTNTVWVREYVPPTSYTITVTTGGNGTASSNVGTATAGTEITLSTTANAGYRFKEWQVVSGGVTIANNKFIMPAGNVEVKAIFELVPVLDEPKLDEGEPSKLGVETYTAIAGFIALLSLGGIALLKFKK